MPLVTYIPEKVRGELRPYWRRRWVILIVAWVVSIIGWLVVLTMPDRYEAMTRIYVETENLLTPLLRNIAIQADMTKQLEVLQRTLLNRNNVTSVAHSADLTLDLHTDEEKEALYTRLAKQISVKAEGNNLFSVTYSNSNPKLAKKIVESLLNIFVETNLGQSRSSMENARNFIEAQIADYERKLKEADERLADYKTHHIDILAGSGTISFSGRLDTARQDLQAAKAKVDDMVILRQQLQSTLGSIPQYLDVDSPGQVIIAGNNGSAVANSPRARVRQLESELSQLEGRFTDQHPDVIATKRALERARKDADEQDRKDAASGSAAGGRGRASNPVYEQTKLRLIQAESDLAQAQSRVRGATEEVQRLQALAESAPKIEAELADLNREYGVIKSKYEELLSRREAARISEAAETKGDKVQFRIIEAPQVPATPSFPNRPLFAAAVFVISLGVGFAVVFLLHQIDDTVSSPVKLSEEFNVRVIGTIPRVESMALAQKRRFEGRNFFIGTGGLFACFLLVLVFCRFQQQLHLDVPLILQRIQDYVG